MAVFEDEVDGVVRSSRQDVEWRVVLNRGLFQLGPDWPVLPHARWTLHHKNVSGCPPRKFLSSLFSP